MTMEKLIAVRFPLKFRKFRSQKIVVTAISIVFFSGALVTFPMIFAVYIGDGSTCNILVDKTQFNVIYAWIFWILQFFIPLSTMGILNILIVKSIRKSRKKVLQFSNNSSKMSSNVKETADMEASDDVIVSVITGNNDSNLNVNNPKDYNTADLPNALHQPHYHIGQGDLTAIPKAKKSETKSKNTYKENSSSFV